MDAAPPVANPHWVQPGSAWVLPEHYSYTPPFTVAFIQDVDNAMDRWIEEMQRNNPASWNPPPTIAAQRHRRWYLQQWMLLCYFNTGRQAYEAGWHGGGGHAWYEPSAQ